ncbi:cytochrome P450 [Streptomyces tsukubensis]|uniref:cytochrome P450 n=1 Tax=Streptomyces tsukubensis TaxID=83656 RepID=UPI001D049414|nr:cytochrome P450 [Streptomyces tsukubensis]
MSQSTTSYTAAPSSAPYPLYTDDFAQNRDEHYRRMRAAHEHIVPVEILPGVFGHLVISLRAARAVLHDRTGMWKKNPEAWAEGLPADSQALGMMGPRPNSLFHDGEQHARYRGVVRDAFALIEPHHLRDMVREVADRLIDRFSGQGTADLVTQFARPLPSFVFNRLFGQDDSAAPQLVGALAGIMESGPEAFRANAEFESYMSRLITEKRARPGANLTTWLLQHPARLDPTEVLHNMVLSVAAAQEPTTNLIGNTTRLLLCDDVVYNEVVNGTLDVLPAMDRVLATRPPMANYGMHYADRDIYFYGRPVPANTPVLVSFEAVGADPTGAAAPASGAGAHMAWSEGPHSCPVSGMATAIAGTALIQLIHRIPDVELAVKEDELRNRPGPFHHALAALPVRFTSVTAPTRGEKPWPSNPYTTSPGSTRQDAASRPRPPVSASWATWLPSSCPAGYGPGHRPGTGSSRTS